MPQLSALLTAPLSGLGYRVHEPAPAKPTGLLVLLHGVGGNESNLAGLAAAAPSGTLVILARGRLELAMGQYAWFRVAFTATGPRIVPEEAEQSRRALVVLLGELQERYGIPPIAPSSPASAKAGS